MYPSPPLRDAALVSINWDGYSVSFNGRGHYRYCNIVLLVLVIFIVSSSSSFLRPADPPPPKARNAAEDFAKIPREAYSEEYVFHNDDNGDGND